MKENSERKVFLLTSHVLEPDIPAGATLVCSLQPPRGGDFIVYVPHEGEPIFRRYAEQADGKILLEAPNRQYDSYTAGKSELLARGTVRVILSFHKILHKEAKNLYEGFDRETHAEPRALPASVPEEDELLTFTEAGKRLKVKRTRLYAMLRGGELRAAKVGKLWRISRSSIEEYLSRSTYSGKQ